MAVGSTLYRFDISLSDVDRGVYESLELRVALHPSETLAFLLTRTLAYCHSWESGIAFSKGLCAADEPAIWVRAADGAIKTWIDIGLPSADRLHKASKLSGSVRVYTHKRVALLKQQCRGERIHNAEAIRVFALDPNFVAELEKRAERTSRWDVNVTHGHLFVTVGGECIDTIIEEHGLCDASA